MSILHLNDFQELKLDSEDFNDFELGYKIIKYDNPEPVRTVPHTGIKLWANPFLLLYVSVSSDVIQNQITLHYGLFRDFWQNIANPNNTDAENLLRNSERLIIEDLKLISEGKKPQNVNIKSVRFVDLKE